MGAVIDGEVVSLDGVSAMADLRLGRATVRVSVRGVSIGQRMRVQLLARDLILAVEEPRGLSVRNRLSGRVVGIADDQDGSLLVSVDIGGVIVLSRVTRDAGTQLGLREGIDLWVLVKATSASTGCVPHPALRGHHST